MTLTPVSVERARGYFLLRIGGLATALLLAGAVTWGLWPAPAPPPPCAALASQGAREEGNRCVVDGDVTTRNYAYPRLPARLTVRGNLQIYGCDVAELPGELVVGKSLDLYKSCITRLPADLIVSGNVDSTLGFGDSLFRCDEVPASVRVGGNIHCD